MLEDGRFKSVDSLTHALGISRAAVQEMLRQVLLSGRLEWVKEEEPAVDRSVESRTRVLTKHAIQVPAKSIQEDLTRLGLKAEELDHLADLPPFCVQGYLDRNVIPSVAAQLEIQVTLEAIDAMIDGLVPPKDSSDLQALIDSLPSQKSARQAEVTFEKIDILRRQTVGDLCTALGIKRSDMDGLRSAIHDLYRGKYRGYARDVEEWTQTREAIIASAEPGCSHNSRKWIVKSLGDARLTCTDCRAEIDQKNFLADQRRGSGSS